MFVYCVVSCVSGSVSVLQLQPVPSFSFGLKSLPALKTVTSDLQVTRGIFILLVAQTHIISRNVFWHFACKSPTIGNSALDSFAICGKLFTKHSVHV